MVTDVSSALTIYLRNHEAVAQARRDLFRRAAANQSDKPYSTELRQLVTEEEEDFQSLREFMRAVKVRPDLVLASTMRLAERVGRLKPNGHLLRRAPLSDLIEIEGLLDTVYAKLACWRALAALQPDERAGSVAVDALIQRAEGQVERLAVMHRSVAGQVLSTH
jgi:hypothetical protein